MKLSINILTAIKIVDDEIVNKELGLSMEIRQKRSLERNSLLAAIDKELETGSKILGLHKDREEQEKSRAKRGKDNAIKIFILHDTTCVNILHFKAF